MRVIRFQPLAYAAAPFVLFAATQCGSRTPAGAAPGPPECMRDDDCDGAGDLCLPVHCIQGTCTELAPVTCDDKDPCTKDVCDPKTGACLHPEAAADLDGDGHRAPLPGKAAGEPGACGDDCDDRNAAAFPGGTEVCDGADNDCNGIVDDGAMLTAGGEANVVLVSQGTDGAGPSALTFANGNYLAALDAEVDKRATILLAPLTRTGMRAAAPSALTPGPADAVDGSLMWIGDRFAVAWSDRREARGGVLNFETYFNLLNPDRTKRMADVRLSQADGFSLHPVAVFTGVEFVVLWQDDGRNAFNIDEVYAQRLDRDGALVASSVKIANEGPQVQTAPAAAVGKRSLGVTWVRGDATEGSHRVIFAPVDFELKPLAPTAIASGAMKSAVYPTIVFAGSQYVIAWHEEPPGPAIWGAVRDDGGKEIVPPKVVTRGNRFARNPALLPFGDRVLLVWDDSRDDNGGYEIYARILDLRLEPLGAEMRLTEARGDSIGAIPAFGPGGDVGILFSDNRTGVPETYFTRLGCAPTKTP